MWVLNSNENLKFRKTETSENDEVLMKCFCSARAKSIPVSGVLLQEKDREVGESLGLETFKASQMDGWKNSGHVTTYLLNRFVAKKNL
ncbi:hypothetical protein AVEN_255664-1 [Araneus ventricosus]|uniref:Uncharacterized protein n=1 Tax=Araneus ventricosus TaxID=182803 RepID=A0A4Y2H2Y9_ARAVE|nr:hypothetical protein AVEN_255664-1 [Araneus ventricosus]